MWAFDFVYPAIQSIPTYFIVIKILQKHIAISDSLIKHNNLNKIKKIQKTKTSEINSHNKSSFTKIYIATTITQIFKRDKI